MFKLYFILTLLTLVAGSPAVFPRAAVDCNAKFGAPGGAYRCVTPDFQQHCNYFKPGFPCMTPDENNLHKSIGPDPGGECTLWGEKGCTGAVL